MKRRTIYIGIVAKDNLQLIVCVCALIFITIKAAAGSGVPVWINPGGIAGVADEVGRGGVGAHQHTRKSKVGMDGLKEYLVHLNTQNVG